jgi:hypothetical protein
MRILQKVLIVYFFIMMFICIITHKTDDAILFGVLYLMTK